MNPNDFSPESPGRLVTLGENLWAFVPDPLPPSLNVDWDVVKAQESAALALANLNGIARRLPNPALFVDFFVKREAVLSSQIEGSRATLYDIYGVHEGELALGNPAEEPEIREVFNYIDTLYYGLKRLETLPLCLRFIRELHERLLIGVRGDQATPGEFRRVQNRIGGNDFTDAYFVPPTVPEMNAALDQFEKYFQIRDHSMPFLMRLAFIHYQFEAIHPFLDGNGRVGRLLISLLLVEWNLLSQPFLYLSAYFEQHRSQYYELLLAVSQRGAWKDWLLYFFRGIEEQSLDAIERAIGLTDLRDEWRDQLGRQHAPGSAIRLMELLFEHSPSITIPDAKRLLNLSYPGAKRVVERLVDAGILHTPKHSSYKKQFVAMDIINMLR